MLKEKLRYLIELMNNKDRIPILNHKLEIIIKDKEFYKMGLMTEIIDKLIENGYEDTIINKFPLLISESIEDETMYVVNKVAQLTNGKNVINNNLKNIYEKLDGDSILELIELLSEEEQEKIKQKNVFAYELYDKELIGENSLGSIIKSDMSKFVEDVIKKVSNGQELKKLNSGTFSDVIETNGYVVKIGQMREKYEIPYHPNILQPLLRKRVLDEKGNSILVIEVQNLVNTKDVTQKDRKKLKEKLDKANIKCIDMQDDNVGILIKPNKRMLYNGVGGINDFKDIMEETLGPGEPVILDTDLIERE